MRRLGFCLLLLSLAGCAALEKHPDPLSGEDLIVLAKSGASAKAIIDEIFRTDTLIPLSAAAILRLLEICYSATIFAVATTFCQRARSDAISLAN